MGFIMVCSHDKQSSNLPWLCDSAKNGCFSFKIFLNTPAIRNVSEDFLVQDLKSLLKHVVMKLNCCFQTIKIIKPKLM